MSVIGRIEVSNFLNLDNIKPYEDDWSPHYPHLVLKCRGTNTIIQLSNGGGKSTLTHGILALLSRNKSCTERVRDILAPKKKGIFTHIRIEVRYRDNLEPFLPGTIDDISGEPYVIGLYGYHDKAESLNFYIYQGTLEDCPVAYTSLSDEGELEIEFEKNSSFIDRLKNQRHWENRTRNDYLNEVHQHFDEKLVEHMVQYQNLGGGDGNSNFFSLKKKPGEDFSTTFFYEHFAPEVLVNCMGQAAEEDERAFEDTLIYSARKVLDIEIRQNEANRNVEQLNHTFGWLQDCVQDISDYEHSREDINSTFASLWHELKFVEDSVLTRPLACIPKEIRNDQNPLSLKVANNLVCREGQWLVPDALIGELINELEARVINQAALRKAIEYNEVKTNQVIEIPCDLALSIKAEGHPTKVYTLENAIRLIDVMSEQYFSTDLSRDAVKRALNFGYTARQNAPEFNPFRAMTRSTNLEIEQHLKTIACTKLIILDSEQEQNQVNDQLKHFEAAETAFMKMRGSGLFTASQLTSPLQTKAEIECDQADSQKLKTNLTQANLALESHRTHYRTYKLEFEDKESPKSTLEDLKADHDVLSVQHTLLLKELANLDSQLETNEIKLNDLQLQKIESEAQESELSRFSFSYQKVTNEYVDGDIIGLSTRLLENQKSCQEKVLQTNYSLNKLNSQNEYFAKLDASYHLFKSKFGDQPATGLKSKLESERRRLESDLQSKKMQRQQGHNKFVILNQLRPIFERVWDIYQVFNRPLSEIANFLKDQEYNLTRELEYTQRTIDELSPLAHAVNSFKAEHTLGIDEILSQHKEHLKALQDKLYVLKERLTNHKEKRALYEDFRIAPQALSKKALNTLKYDGKTVHDVIYELDINTMDKKMMLTAFSQLLHAPVAESHEEALQMITVLHQADLDYPVFLRSTLTNWVTQRPNDLSDLLIGQESLQVKAILDPDYLPQLITQISEKIYTTETEMKRVQLEVSEYGLDAERYQFLQTAKQGFDRDATIALNNKKNRLNQLENESTRISAFISNSAYAMLPQAIQYLNEGGNAEWQHLEEDIARLSEVIAENVISLETLDEQLSEDNVNLLGMAEQFEMEGGNAQYAILQNKLTALKKEAIDVEIGQRIANEQYGKYFQHAKDAESFLVSGGQAKSAELKLTLVKLADIITEVTQAIKSSKEQRKAITLSSTSLADKVVTAHTQVAQWEKGLISAQQYVDAGGVEFDRTFNAQIDAIDSKQSLYQKQLQHMFELAQQYVESKTQNSSREALMERLEVCTDRLNAARIELDNAQLAKEKKQEQLISLAYSTTKFDSLTIKLIQRYKETADILANLQSAVIVTDVATSSYLETARQMSDDFRVQTSAENWETTLNLFDELVDIIQYFKFSERDKELKHKTSQLTTRLTSITTVVAKQCKVDTGLKDGERKELSDKSGEMIFPVIRSFKSSYESLVLDAERKRDALTKDVRQQQDNLTDALIALSRNLEDNFELMKRILKPGKTTAGFFIEADVIGSSAIRDKIEALIASIRVKEVARRNSLETEKATGIRLESDKDYLEGLKKHVRENFYRTIFIGKNDETEPKVSFEHPCLNAGRRKRVSPDYSTGQKTALSLLLLTKIAQFAAERDAYTGLIMRSRTRAKKTPSNKVVLIDGLFSNLSDPELIRFSLETVRMMQDQFQLIGWVHSPHYRNDPDIFPTFYSIQRVDNQGRIMRAKELSQNQTMMTSAVLFMDPISK